MNRASKGDGGIRQRTDGLWEARFRLEGRSRSFYGKTKDEARRKMRKAQTRIEDGLPVPSERTTVAQYLDSWLLGKQATLTPESARRYSGRIARLLPHIGHYRLARLQPVHLRDAYSALGQQVGGTTVQLCHGVIHTALRDAEREGMVARNVASMVTAPRRSTREFRALSAVDAKVLLRAAKDDPLEAFYTTALTTGLRLGELQALQWSDVNLERGRLTVRRTLAVDGKPVFSATSSKKNHNRTVWLSQAASSALERLRTTQSALREQAGPAWNDYGLVFTSPVGNPLSGKNHIGRMFPKLLANAGLPRMRFHDLRHSAASLLLAEGVPVKVVSEMLGHTDVSTTLRIYAHVLEGAQEQATSVMDRLLHG